MDVVLTDDKSISREKHCSGLYDPKGNEFYVTAEKSNIVYLNGDLVTEPHSLKLGDVIKVGETELKFIPYCQEDITWEKE